MKRLMLSTSAWLMLSTVNDAHAHTQAAIDAGRGPVSLLIPDGYVADTPVPLIVSLHGFGGSGDSYIQYWEKNGLVDTKGFIVAAPTGTTNSKGRAFWNASAACCDKDRSGIDDSSYIRSVIEAVQAAYTIDPKSIHVTGYSNGGFMAHRMACDHPDLVASIAAVAGASRTEEQSCNPKQSAHILHIHGTADTVIRYEGGKLKNYTSDVRVPHPGAEESVQFWARLNGAQPVEVNAPMMDLSHRTPGPDTSVLRYERSSPFPVTIELWSISGETHVPKMTQAFHTQSTDWMLSHRKASQEAE